MKKRIYEVKEAIKKIDKQGKKINEQEEELKYMKRKNKYLDDTNERILKLINLKSSNKQKEEIKEIKIFANDQKTKEKYMKYNRRIMIINKFLKYNDVKKINIKEGIKNKKKMIKKKLANILSNKINNEDNKDKHDIVKITDENNLFELINRSKKYIKNFKFNEKVSSKTGETVN